MEFEKISTVSVQENVTQVLLKKILSGEIKPGEKLPSERELASLMGVSRGTLHQAILDLASKGFLEILPRHGTVVNDYREKQTPQSLSVVMSYGSDSLSRPLFLDLMATRRLLEVECARLSCSNIYPTTLEKMKEIVEELATEQDIRLASDLIFRFHYTLVKASGNSIYSMVYRGFESILQTLIQKHYALRPGDLQETITLNRALVESIEKKDEEKAMLLTRELLDLGVDTLKEKY